MARYDDVKRSPLGRRIWRLAKLKGVSLGWISRNGPIDRSQLNRIMSGDTENPGVFTILPVAIALGVPLDALVWGIEGGREPPSVDDFAAMLDLAADLEPRPAQDIKRLRTAAEKVAQPASRTSKAVAPSEDEPVAKSSQKP